MCAPALAAAVCVMSSHWSHEARPLSALPTASKWIGLPGTSGACSRVETISAVAPSTAMSQSNRHSGSLIIFDDR